MPKLPWIKLYTEIIDDPKLYRLPEALKWRFVQLLALAGECDAEGYLSSSTAPLDPADIAWRLRIDPQLLLSDLQALAQIRLVVLDQATNTWLIPSFASRQSRPDDETRAYWREKKRRQRTSHASPSAGDPLVNDSAEIGIPEPSSAVESPRSNASISENVPENVPLKSREEQRKGDKRRKEERQNPAHQRVTPGRCQLQTPAHRPRPGALPGAIQAGAEVHINYHATGELPEKWK